jgi:hypothetical protein
LEYNFALILNFNLKVDIRFQSENKTNIGQKNFLYL